MTSRLGLTRRGAALGLALSLTLVVGCGGGGDDTSEDPPPESTSTTPTTLAATTTTAPPDPFAGATAASLLATPADLGPEWTTGPAGTPTKCNGAPLAEDPLTYGSPLDAAQASFESDALGAVQTVALHRDAAAARAALDAWRTKMVSCVRTGSDSGYEYTINMSPAALGPYGDETWAAVFAIEVAGQTFAGREVLYTQGRALVQFNIVGANDQVTDQRADELMAVVLAQAAPPGG